MRYALNLLVIGAGPTQAAAISATKRLGCRVVAVDGNPDAPGLKLADVSIVHDVKDVEKAVCIGRENRIDGVLSVASEVCLPAVAAVNNALRLPGLTPEQVALATNKGAMRKRYAECGIPSTPYFVIDGKDQIPSACGKVGFPAVIKPVDNAGSRGVSYVEALDQVQTSYDKAKVYSRSGRVILEKYMPGTEVAVEAFVAGGKITILTLSDKERTDPPYLLDTAVMFPSAHPPELQEQIKDIAIRAILALGLDNCPIHMEQMVTSDGPKVVELAARGPGFRVYTDIIPHVTGVNVVEAQVCLLLGESPSFMPQLPLKGACIRFWGGKRGRVRSISGVEASTTFPGVYDLDIYVKRGDSVHNLTSGDDRIGHVITLADTREEACATAQRVFETVNIEIDEGNES
ncbi:MAG: ATP-grasp domain-containing protein [Phycisphaerales bacterium]|nr:MAG: ATP-grasp domain-containing protein [Phycisphaerales bacterium]